MSTSFGNATFQAAPVMNRGGGTVIGEVSASVECFVRERALSPRSGSASLSRRTSPRRLHRVQACVESARLHVGQSRRGSTSEVPDRLRLGSAPTMRALVVPVRSHSVRPNYAFERTANRRRNHRRHHAAAQRER
jgi:hypothetical protein